MFWMIITCVLFTICIMWCRLGLRKHFELASKLNTSLKSYPIIGHVLHFLGSNEDRMTALKTIGRDAIENGGISKLWFSGQLVVCIADPIILDAIINTCLEKHDYFLSILKFVIGDSSVLAPVPIWRPRRKLMAPIFSMKNLVLYTEIFSKKSFVMADLLKKKVEKGDFSISEFTVPYAMDTLCETTLGIKMYSLETSSKHELSDAVKKLGELGGQLVCQPWLRFEFIHKWFPQYNIAVQLKKVMCNFAMQVIQEKRTKILGNRGHSSQNEEKLKMTSFFDHALQNDECCSEKLLLEETLLLMVAGFDTNYISIGFTALLLSRHPIVQDKVHKELDKVLGNTARQVTYQDLLQLKYLEAVIKESLRLYPPAPVILRKIDRDVTLPSGLTLVEGCAALINMWALHRNPEYWGPDADEFRPERFLEAPLKHPAAFAPFSYGVRGCVGSQYAMLSIKMNLAVTLHRYQIMSASDNPGEIKTKFEITMRDVDDFIVRLEYKNKTK